MNVTPQVVGAGHTQQPPAVVIPQGPNMPTYEQLYALYADAMQRIILLEQQANANAHIAQHNAALATQATQSLRQTEQLLHSERSAVNSRSVTPPQMNLSTSTVVSTPDKTSYSDKVKNNKPRIPPVYVSNVKNITDLTNILTSLECEKPTLQTLASGDVKIASVDENSYRKIVNTLELISRNSNHQLYGLSFHSFQLKSEKPYIVVIRGLHPTTPVEDIKNELLMIGHEANSITNVIIKKTTNKKDREGNVVSKQTYKLALPLFFVHLVPKDNNKNIYETTHLLYSKVKIEAPRKKREIPQCKNCQQFGHTRTYCAHKSRCVKCGKEHITTQCQKKKEQKAKCANCQGEHTANWRGCPTYKAKIAATVKPKVTASHRVQQKPSESAYADNKVPSAEQEKMHTQPKQNQHPTEGVNKKEPTVNDIWNFLQKMDARLDKRISKMEARIFRLENQANHPKKAQTGSQ